VCSLVHPIGAYPHHDVHLLSLVGKSSSKLNFQLIDNESKCTLSTRLGGSQTRSHFVGYPSNFGRCGHCKITFAALASIPAFIDLSNHFHYFIHCTNTKGSPRERWSRLV